MEAWLLLAPYVGRDQGSYETRQFHTATFALSAPETFSRGKAKADFLFVSIKVIPVYFGLPLLLIQVVQISSPSSINANLFQLESNRCQDFLLLIHPFLQWYGEIVSTSMVW